MSRPSRADSKSDRRRTVLLAFLLLMILIVGGSGLAYFARQRSIQIAYDEAPSIPQLPKPDPPQGVYGGSEKCATCHQAIAKKYATHPMSRSVASIVDASPIEDFDLTLVTADTPERYYVQRQDGQVNHHESVLNAETGDVIYDRSESIQFAIGSGRRERFYLLQREGVLLQSPIIWQVKEGRWRLAHGFAEGKNPHFGQRVGDDCLFCHAGRTATDMYGKNRYDTNTFHEAAIGCERCHGPGEAHVKKQTANPCAG